MNTNYIKNTSKVVFCFCFILLVGYLPAQNIGNYDYITPYSTDTCRSGNPIIFKVNNQYYFFSNVRYDEDSEVTPTVIVFDEKLNIIKHILLDVGGYSKIYYNENYFYIFGYLSDSLLNVVYYAKYDEDFNLAQPITTYVFDDTPFSWIFSYILMTKNNEFIILFSTPTAASKSYGHFLHINNKGEILQDVCVSIFPCYFGDGTLVETDSYYIMNFRHSDVCFLRRILLFCKDSLEKYEWQPVEESSLYASPDGYAITVGNQLIRESGFGWMNPEDCSLEEVCYHSLMFYNEDFSLKKRLDIDEGCIYDTRGRMSYINPDSIYYAYPTIIEMDNEYGWGSTISIACFNSEGELHFNYTLDLPDPWGVKGISNVQVLSNGDILIAGTNRHGSIFSSTTKVFLLLYHPPKDINIKEYTVNGVEMRIFPNPTQTHFTVTNIENVSLQLYNMLGQKVFSTYSKEENTIINVNTLPQGLYVLKVVKNGVVSTHKIVVR